MLRAALRVFPFLFLVILPAGCKEKLPSDLPKLYPAEVVVTMDGAPLSDATVTLYPQNAASGQSGLPVGGTTDAKGVAKLQTMGRYSGSPEGPYKICVNKTVDVEGPTSKKTPPSDPKALKAYNQKIEDERMSLPALEDVFRDPKKTPLEMTIATSGKNSQAVEVRKKPGTPGFNN